VTKEEERIWEDIYKAARLSSARTARIGRHLISQADAFQHSIVWALEHWHKITEWDAQESLSFKLRKTFNNEGQKLVAKERASRSNTRTSDNFYYTTEVLHQLLRDVWNYEGWLDTPDMSSEFVSKSSKPNEGNNRLAMFSDLSTAIGSLNKADQELLRQKYQDGGMEFDELALAYSVSEEAIRKRVKRAIVKLQDRLGGEAPMWNSRRRVRTNAQARQDLKEAE
jgi:RNA polymerase sigma factor (sigma-70 family)